MFDPVQTTSPPCTRQKKIEKVENYNSADRQTKEQNSLTAANHKLTHNLLQRVAHITSDEQ